MLLLTPNKAGNTHVYSVHIATDGACVYVGRGSIHDIISFRQLLAMPGFDESIEYEIRFHGTTTSVTEAWNLQTTVMREAIGYQPVFNTQEKMANRYRRVRCKNDGSVYRSAIEVVRHYGIAQSALSQHLRRAKGFKSIKGLQFEYVLEDIPMEYLTAKGDDAPDYNPHA